MAQTNLMLLLKKEFPDAEIRDFAQVARLLDLTSRYNGRAWLFRGASTTVYDLIPKIGRGRKKKATGQIIYDARDERAVLDVFKSRARAFLSYEPNSDLEWLALAQHHGAPTRLLDWSEGLLVALWFAAEDCIAPERATSTVKAFDGCLWCAWDIPVASKRSIASPLAAQSLGLYRPPHIDRRIASQQSVFTLVAQPTEAVIHKNIFKLTVASDFKFTLRKRLDSAGINRRTLFPDLSGLGDDLSWRYTNNYLTTFRDTQEKGR